MDRAEPRCHAQGQERGGNEAAHGSRRGAAGGVPAKTMTLTIAALMGISASAADQTATWLGNGDGTSWTDPLNWSTPVFPNNNGTSFDAVIGDGFDVLLSDEPDQIAIQALNLGNAAGLTLDPDGFNPGPLKINADSTNDGTITLPDAELWVQSDLTLGGSGTIVLSGNGGNLISQNDSDLTLGADQTVQTQGPDSFSRMFGFGMLTNRGTIESVGGRRLEVIGSGSAAVNVTNTGWMRARDGGMLLLEAAHVDQTGGGVITVEAGSTLRLDDSPAPDAVNRITGGTINGGGTIEAWFGALDGVTLAGGITTQADDLTVANTVTNNGELTIPHDGSLRVEGDATISGTGTVKFVNERTFEAGGAITGDGDPTTDDALTLGSGQTLRLDNPLLEAEARVDVASDGLIDLSAGELAIRNGATLTARNQMHLRDGATLRINDGNLAVVGGTLTMDGGAALNGSSADGVHLDNATVNGSAGAVNVPGLTVSGTNTIDLPMQLSTVTASGPAAINGSGGLTNGDVLGDGDDATDDALTLGPDQAWDITGHITGDSSVDVPLINHAAVTVSDGGVLRLNEPSENHATLAVDGSDASFNRLNINAALNGAGQITLTGGADAELNVTSADTFANTVTGDGVASFDANGATGDRTNVTSAYAHTGTTVIDGGTVAFQQPAGTLGRVEVNTGSARFENGLTQINELTMEGFGDPELFVDGDTTVQAIDGPAFGGAPPSFLGTLSGPGTTTINDAFLASEMTIDGRTVVAQADVAVAALDIVNGGRLISTSADTLTSIGTTAGTVNSSDGAGVLENRGRVTNGTSPFGGNPIPLVINTRYQQTDDAVTEALSVMRFTAGGTIDGRVITHLTGFNRGIDFTTDDGREVSYTFPDTSSITGEGNVIFDGANFNGEGSLEADINGTYQLTGDDSTTTVRDGAEVTIDVNENSNLGEELDISNGGSLALRAVETTAQGQGLTALVGPTDARDQFDVEMRRAAIDDGELLLNPEIAGRSAGYAAYFLLKVLSRGEFDIIGESDDPNRGFDVRSNDFEVDSASDGRITGANIEVQNTYTQRQQSSLELHDDATLVTNGLSVFQEQASIVGSGGDEALQVNGTAQVKTPFNPQAGAVRFEDLDIELQDKAAELFIEGGAGMTLQEAAMLAQGAASLSTGPDATLNLVDSSIDAGDQSTVELGNNASMTGDGNSSLNLSANATFKVHDGAMVDGIALDARDDSQFWNAGTVYQPFGDNETFSFRGQVFAQEDTSPGDDTQPAFELGQSGVMVGGIEGEYDLERQADPPAGEQFSSFGASYNAGNLTFLLGTDVAASQSPGNSPGRATLTADTVRFGSQLTTLIELAGDQQGVTFDLLEIAGDLELGDSDLVLQLLDEFDDTTAPDDTFTVITSEDLTGTFANVAPGQRLTTAGGRGSFEVHFGPDSPFDPDSVVLTGFVPEPTTATLLALGGLALLRRRRP